MKRLLCVLALAGALLCVAQTAQAHPYRCRPGFYGPPAVVFRPPVVAYRPYVAYRAPVVVPAPPVYGGVYYRGPAFYGPPVGPSFSFGFGYGGYW